MKTKLSGRLRLTQRLCSSFDNFLSSIERKETRFANFNTDINIGAHLEILAFGATHTTQYKSQDANLRNFVRLLGYRGFDE